MSRRTVLIQNLSDHLRQAVHYFAITDAMDDLSLTKLDAERAQSIQFAFVYGQFWVFRTRQIWRILEDDTEGCSEGRD